MTLAEKVDKILEKVPCVDIKDQEYIQYPKPLIDQTQSQFIKLIDEELGTSFSKEDYCHRQGVIYLRVII
jgi:hypothetical protein